MQAIVNAIQFVLNFFVEALSWIGRLFIQVFVDLWEFVTDAFVWVFDSLLGIASGAITSINVGSIPRLDSQINSLPAEILNILGLLGVGYALGIITTALLIRFGLQLIPFVRLGS